LLKKVYFAVPHNMFGGHCLPAFITKREISHKFQSPEEKKYEILNTKAPDTGLPAFRNLKGSGSSAPGIL
jgi:hypothetical protein